MISPNIMSSVLVVISETEDLAGDTIVTEETVTMHGLFAHGSTSTTFGADRDIISQQANFITFEDFPTKCKYIVVDGEKYSIDGKPQKYTAPTGWKLRVGTVVNLKRVSNG